MSHSSTRKSPKHLLDPVAYPWVLSFGAVAIIAFCLDWPMIWMPVLIPLIVILFFFRDPPRRVPNRPGELVSPADGTVTHIQVNENPEAGPVGGLYISIFLSVFNVHVNRIPYDGRVGRIYYKRGGFVDARLPECPEVNEANWVFLETEAGPMTVRQISGKIARRIICRVREGETVRKGQRYGIICFGSRTEVILHPDATALVHIGQKVKGGATPLAKLEIESSNP